MTFTTTATIQNLASIPSISITTPTPPRPIGGHDPQAVNAFVNTPTANSSGGAAVPPSYRLLYRGALSLPDSHLLLDGLTFAARLDSPSKQSVFNLLENPLALALESMRGRPSLRFMGSVKLAEVYLDESGGVEMDIHPLAILSRIYFENMFCLLPFSTAASSLKTGAAGRSEIGIKIALGDSNGPETTEIVIFGQLVPSSGNSKTIRLCVARLCQRSHAPQPLKRLPRPDDPIPRKPPAFFLRDLKRTGSLGVMPGRELKRVASGSTLGIGPLKKQKLADANGIAADLGSGVRLGGLDVEGDKMFKVPELPNQMKQAKTKGKGKEKDVFGDVAEVGRGHPAEGKSASAKGKQKAVDEVTADETALEKANKNVIKRATIEYLGRTKDPTGSGRFIDKTHSEFKDLYGSIYRGVGFALRAKMRAGSLELGVINRLVDMHALMYLGGCGGSAGEGDPGRGVAAGS